MEQIEKLSYQLFGLYSTFRNCIHRENSKICHLPLTGSLSTIAFYDLPKALYMFIKPNHYKASTLQ